MSDIVRLLDALGRSDVDWTQLLSNSINIAEIGVEAAEGKEAVTISEPVDSQQTVANEATSAVNILPVSTGSSSSATHEITAAEYLARGKKRTHAQQCFRHMLKKASIEAQIWGRGTIKDLQPSRLKHIHDRIYSQCPSLRGYEKDVDKVLAKSLIEAKHYQKRKEKASKRKKIQKYKSEKKVKVTKTKIPSYSPSSSTSSNLDCCDIEEEETKQKTKNYSVSMDTKSKSHYKSKGKRPAKKAKGKGKDKNVLKGKSKHSPRPSESDDSEIEDGQSTQNLRTEKESKTKRKLKKKTMDSTSKFKIGASVLVTYQGQNLATGTFRGFHDDTHMYAKVCFDDHLMDDTSIINPELPEKIQENSKSHFHHLEKDDVFIWKTERLKTNLPSGGYVIGVQPSKDIFLPPVEMGKRIPKPKKTMNI